MKGEALGSFAKLLGYRPKRSSKRRKRLRQST